MVTNHPLRNQISPHYLTKRQIDRLWAASTLEFNDNKVHQLRFQAYQWIIDTSSALRFPVATQGTALILFHRFFLFYSLGDFNLIDVAGACLFVATKIEDTLKKLRDIIIAAFEIKQPAGVFLDQQVIEEQRKRLISVERKVLETCCFDFRYEHPQQLIVKFCKYLSLPKDVAELAWMISLDSYKTFTPLIFTVDVIAMGCISLACKLKNAKFLVHSELNSVNMKDAGFFVADMLELYMTHVVNTQLKGLYDVKVFLQIRIDMNKASEGVRHDTRPVTEVKKDILLGSKNAQVGDKGTVRYLLDGSREKAGEWGVAGMLDSAK